MREMLYWLMSYGTNPMPRLSAKNSRITGPGYCRSAGVSKGCVSLQKIRPAMYHMKEGGVFKSSGREREASGLSNRP